MSSMIPDEGLDEIIETFLKNGGSPTSLYIGLFTSQTASTVPDRDATGDAAPSGFTEASGTSYARQAIAAASWGANADNGNGRKTIARLVPFTAAGSGGWGTANGFFLATMVSSQAGDKLVYFANFDDLTASPINENDVIKITPAMQFDGV